MPSEIGITITSKNEANAGIEAAEKSGERLGNTMAHVGSQTEEAGGKFAALGEKTDQIASKTGTATGAFGALQSGIDLLNLKSEQRKQAISVENEELDNQIAKLSANHDAQGKIPPAIQAQIDALNQKKAANDSEVVELDKSEQKTAKYAGALQAAALASDAISGATDLITLATQASSLAKIKDTAITVGHAIAQKAAAIASGIWTAAQWLLNVALSANPIGLIIIAIVALIAIVVLIATKTTWFQTIWKYVWGFIKDAAAAVVNWFKGPFLNFFKAAFDFIKNLVMDYFNFWVGVWSKVIGFLMGIPDRIRSIANRMWSALTDGFRAAVNTIIRGWNAIDFGIHVHLPSWIPVIGGSGFDINDVIPDIPYLARGGTATRGGLAVVGERGAEVVDLPGGSSVYPNGTGPGSGGPGWDLTGAETEFKRWLQRLFNGGRFTIPRRSIV